MGKDRIKQICYTPSKFFMGLLWCASNKLNAPDYRRVIMFANYLLGLVWKLVHTV